MLSVSDQDSEHVGQGVPRRPQRNCIFVIDADELEDPNDVTCDDNGTWKVKKGAMSYYYKLCGGKLISISEADYQQSDEAFHFKGRSYRCGSLNAFSKTFWWAEDRRCPFVMLQYIFDGPEQAFQLNSHKGCSVQTTSYRRVFPSTMSSIKRDLQSHSMKKLELQQHSFSTPDHPCQMIRDKRQIFNAAAAGIEDGTTQLLIKCTEEAKNPENQFIREVNVAPKFSVFLATSTQLGDLARFCTNPLRYSILSIDTTFNIGKYYVTVAVYRHLMLLSKLARFSFTTTGKKTRTGNSFCS